MRPTRKRMRCYKKNTRETMNLLREELQKFCKLWKNNWGNAKSSQKKVCKYSEMKQMKYYRWQR